MASLTSIINQGLQGIKNFFSVYWVEYEIREKVEFETLAGEMSGYKVKTEIILEFETIMEMEYTANSNITSYPIETAKSATDYKYEDPDILECKGIISRNSMASFFGWSIENLTTSIGINLQDKKRIIEKIEDNLKFLKSGMHRVNVITKTAKRKGYTLTKYSISETADNFGVFEVDMTFNQIIDIELEEYAVSDVKNPSDSNTVSSGTAKTKAM